MDLADFINVPLLMHPYNWIIVILILALSSAALCLLIAPLGSIGGLTTVY
jgi:hypothetical protein